MHSPPMPASKPPCVATARSWPTAPAGDGRTQCDSLCAAPGPVLELYTAARVFRNLRRYGTSLDFVYSHEETLLTWRMLMSPHRMFVCLLPLILAVPAIAGAQGDTFEETVPLEPGGQLSLDASGGSVLLLAWDRPQVEIQARIEAPAGVDGDYARDIVQATTVDVRTSGGAVSIRNDFGEVERRGFFDRRRTMPDVHYEIRAPRELNLDINLERGAGTTLRGFGGQILMNVDRSDLNLVELTGTLRINLVRGQLQATDFSGSLTLTVDRGERAVLTRLRGSVLIEADRTNVVLRDVRFDGDSDVTIDRGDFDIELAESQPLTIDAELSSRAEFNHDLPVTLQQSGNGFQGTVNGGGPQLRIRADRGEVRLRSN